MILAQQSTKPLSATQWQHQRGTSFSEIQAKKLTTSHPFLAKPRFWLGARGGGDLPHQAGYIALSFCNVASKDTKAFSSGS